MALLIIACVAPNPTLNPAFLAAPTSTPSSTSTPTPTATPVPAPTAILEVEELPSQQLSGQTPASLNVDNPPTISITVPRSVVPGSDFQVVVVGTDDRGVKGIRLFYSWHSVEKTFECVDLPRSCQATFVLQAPEISKVEIFVEARSVDSGGQQSQPVPFGRSITSDVEVIIPGDKPRIIPHGLMAKVQDQEFQSFEAKIGDTGWSLREIVAAVYYDLTGKSIDEKAVVRKGEPPRPTRYEWESGTTLPSGTVRSPEGLERRLLFFFLSDTEYYGFLDHYRISSGQVHPGIINTPDGESVSRVEVYVAISASKGRNKKLTQVLDILTHELGHAYFDLYYQMNCLHCESDQREALAQIFGTAIMRTLEGHGLTSNLVADSPRHRADIKKLSEQFLKENLATWTPKGILRPHDQGFVGVWRDVAADVELRSKVLARRLTGQELLDFGVQLTQRRWGWQRNEYLTVEEQSFLTNALLNRLSDGEYPLRSVYNPSFAYP